MQHHFVDESSPGLAFWIMGCTGRPAKRQHGHKPPTQDQTCGLPSSLPGFGEGAALADQRHACHDVRGQLGLLTGMGGGLKRIGPFQGQSLAYAIAYPGMAMQASCIHSSFLLPKAARHCFAEHVLRESECIAGATGEQWPPAAI